MAAAAPFSLSRTRGTVVRRLQGYTRAGGFFVICERPDRSFYVAAPRPVDRTTTLRFDHTIRFNGEASRRNWPERMRRVGLFDSSSASVVRPLNEPAFVNFSAKWVIHPIAKARRKAQSRRLKVI